MSLPDRPLVLDAALGTRLIAFGLDIHRDDSALWNLKRPEVVLDVHRRDIAAGAHALLTNSFGANRLWLRRFGAEQQMQTLNRRAVELARAAAGGSRLVFGSIGPSATEPEACAEQARALGEAGVDALVLETWRFSQAQTALRALRPLTDVPLVISLVEWPEPLDQAAAQLLAAGATVLGMNCQVGMEPALKWAEQLGPLTQEPLWVKPGGGLPGQPAESPASFTEAVPRLLAAGVRFLGGCCGTTEAHVAALRQAVDQNRMPRKHS